MSRDGKDFNKVMESQVTAMMYSDAYHSELILEDRGYTLNITISKNAEESKEESEESEE